MAELEGVIADEGAAPAVTVTVADVAVQPTDALLTTT
jgi:hypothetical protein